jgi:hypothetical protein
MSFSIPSAVEIQKPKVSIVVLVAHVVVLVVVRFTPRADEPDAQA